MLIIINKINDHKGNKALQTKKQSNNNSQAKKQPRLLYVIKFKKTDNPNNILIINT